MKHHPPKSIKVVGVIIAIVSFFIVFSNGGSAIVWIALDFDEGFGELMSRDTNLVTAVLKYFPYIGIGMACIGIMYLIGGIFITKYKFWANQLVSVVSGLLVVVILLTSAILVVSVIQVPNPDLHLIFIIGIIGNALLWSFPLVLLIRYLNKRKIKKHFS